MQGEKMRRKKEIGFYQVNTGNYSVDGIEF